MKWAGEGSFDDIINAEAQSFGLDPSLIKAIIAQESGFNPKAVHQDAGGRYSAGLMQVENTTFANMGFTGPIGSPSDLTGFWNPTVNVHYGARLLYDLLNQLGNIPDAVSAYNGGIRPELGFGRTAQAPVTVDGHPVVVGEYGNNDYVVKVLTNLTYFRQQAGTMAGGGPLVPGATISFTPTMLTIALVVAFLWYILSPKGRS